MGLPGLNLGEALFFFYLKLGIHLNEKKLGLFMNYLDNFLSKHMFWVHKRNVVVFSDNSLLLKV